MFFSSSPTEAGPEKLNTKFISPISKLKLPVSTKNKKEHSKRNSHKVITPPQAIRNNSKSLSSKKPFREKKISLLPSGRPKNSLKVKSSTSLCLMPSVLEMAPSKKTKSQSDKKNSRNSLTKNVDLKIRPWNPSHPKSFHNMLNKICTKKSWDNKNDNENKDSNDSESKSSKVCTRFLPIFSQSQDPNPFMNTTKKSTDSSLSLYLGTVKWIFWKEFRKKKMKEGKEYFNKSSISTVNMTFLKVWRKCLKDKLNPRAKWKEWELKVKLLPTPLNAHFSPELRGPFQISKWFTNIFTLISKTENNKRSQSNLFPFPLRTVLTGLVQQFSQIRNRPYTTSKNPNNHKFQQIKLTFQSHKNI